MTAADSLGNQFGGYKDIVEHVPVEVMDKFRDPDTDRWKPVEEENAGFGPAHIRNLAEAIKKNGIREPLIVIYGQEERKAVLGEGHHRLEAAKLLGHKDVPVRVIRQHSSPKNGISVPGAEPNKHNYVRGDLRPSEIGINGFTDWQKQKGI